MKLYYITFTSLCLLSASAHPLSGDETSTEHVARKEPWDGPLPVEDWSDFDVPPDAVRRELLPRKEPWDGPLPVDESFEVPLDSQPEKKDLPKTTEVAQRNPQGSDLAVRDLTDFQLFSYIGWKTFAIANGAIAFWGIVEDCKEFAKEGDVKAGITCVWDAISTLVGFACAGQQAYKSWVTLDQRLRQNGWTIAGLAGGRAPYANQIPGGIGKREAIPMIEDVLSKALRSEVRHIGDWHQQNSPLVARDEGDDDSGYGQPVFGLDVGGVPMHISYMGETNNGSRIRLGHGPGPETTLNKRRLQGRSSQKYNNQFFDSGGLVMVSQTDPHELISDDMYFNPDNEDDFRWIINQVKCNMGGVPVMGPNGVIGYSGMSAQGAQFQVYNRKDEHTLTIGAISPFGGENSPLDDMEVTQGIKARPECSVL